MSGKELGIDESNIQQQRITLFLKFNSFYNLIFLRCFGLHQYINAKILNKEDKSVKPPIPKISLRMTNRNIEYGAVPEIIIERDTKVKVTPHFFSAKRAEEDTIPTIAEGQPRLIARVILATFKGGP
tara:strand:+ start:34 stop:414 length:381 start_codon:yes stop_codon:yes gene_type:complete